MSISIKVKSSKITKYFSTAIKLLQNPQPFLRQIGILEKGQTQLRFQKGEDPQGKAWKKLAIRKGQPLLDSGRLRNSISFVTTKDSVFIGTNVSYAKTHQFGATITPKNKPILSFKVGNSFFFSKKSIIPARPFLGVNKKTEQNVIETMKRFLKI
jgi:phage virion morphogenesis protein